eukprot:TRINITY_DN1642_c0_g1_i1.p1 TRINITY_DN1642_c0_g1~~TRINITY_DN1642_c0_g1_i1.p1  ORF type:complete len:1278 (+),score=391.88 TRINITY_DN1642_c0_g1_i1:69-3902(+)
MLFDEDLDVDAAEQCVRTIAGFEVHFPFQPYPSQFQLMTKVLKCLQNSENGLLESPTGTGKTLALLCATLAWNRRQAMESVERHLRERYEAGEDLEGTDLAGKKRTPEELDRCVEEGIERFRVGNFLGKFVAKHKKRIFFASRTHAQIAQLTKELRRTVYRPKMVILGSRDHYCINRRVRASKSRAEECLALLENGGCRLLKKPEEISRSGLLDRVWDMEDFVSVGKECLSCPYFAAKEMLSSSEIVFCPYNYLLHPNIRSAVGIDLKDSIVIFDEAHNIEDHCRSETSFDLEIGLIKQCQRDVEFIMAEMRESPLRPPVALQFMDRIIKAVVDWIDRNALELPRVERDHGFKSWKADEILQVMEKAEIKDAFDFEEMYKVVQDFILDSDPAGGENESTSGTSSKGTKGKRKKSKKETIITKEMKFVMSSLLGTFQFLYANDGAYVDDYVLAVEMQHGFGGGRGAPSDPPSHLFCLWCMNPQVAFEPISSACRSVILTSGTLSPMDSFSSELGSKFPQQLEAAHVIPSDQVTVMSALKGPHGVSMKTVFANSESHAFQDSLGQLLLSVFQTVPGGVLCFFPSYSFMNRMITRWKMTSLWKMFERCKYLFEEPRGRGAPMFQDVLKGYYEQIALCISDQERMDAFYQSRKSEPDSEYLDVIHFQKTGAALFAVYRGRVSEGMDFSHDSARAVVAVGIPFANVKDQRIKAKRDYNEKHSASRGLLGSSAWYEQQAFRALNQAIGRCIRNVMDYGAIILVDQRFRAETAREKLSRWVRRKVRTFDDVRGLTNDLRNFFSLMGKKGLNVRVSSEFLPEPRLDDEDAVIEKDIGVDVDDGDDGEMDDGEKEKGEKGEEGEGEGEGEEVWKVKGDPCVGMDVEGGYLVDEKEIHPIKAEKPFLHERDISHEIRGNTEEEREGSMHPDFGAKRTTTATTKTTGMDVETPLPFHEEIVKEEAVQLEFKQQEHESLPPMGLAAVKEELDDLDAGFFLSPEEERRLLSRASTSVAVDSKGASSSTVRKKHAVAFYGATAAEKAPSPLSSSISSQRDRKCRKVMGSSRPIQLDMPMKDEESAIDCLAIDSLKELAKLAPIFASDDEELQSDMQGHEDSATSRDDVQSTSTISEKVCEWVGTSARWMLEHITNDHEWEYLQFVLAYASKVKSPCTVVGDADDIPRSIKGEILSVFKEIECGVGEKKLISCHSGDGDACQEWTIVPVWNGGHNVFMKCIFAPTCGDESACCGCKYVEIWPADEEKFSEFSTLSRRHRVFKIVLSSQPCRK